MGLGNPFRVSDARVSIFVELIKREMEAGRVDMYFKARTGYVPSDKYLAMLLHGDRREIERAFEIIDNEKVDRLK